MMCAGWSQASVSNAVLYLEGHHFTQFQLGCGAAANTIFKKVKVAMMSCEHQCPIGLDRKCAALQSIQTKQFEFML